MKTGRRAKELGKAGSKSEAAEIKESPVAACPLWAEVVVVWPEVTQRGN